MLLVQNPGAATVTGNVWFWQLDGTLAASQPLSLAAHAQLALDTSTIVPGASGSITVTHDGPYAGLTGKTVALEPVTGFSFDTPMTYRAR